MQPDQTYWAHKLVCVTGGTGFLGWHLVRELLPRARHVRILGLAPRSPVLRSRLAMLEFVAGDVRDATTVHKALRDCDVVFHAAGATTTWGPGLRQMREIHVAGTEQVLQALPVGARLVHTSSVVTIGASSYPKVLNEASPFDLPQLPIHYVHAKRAAEELALAAAARGLDVTVLNPAYLVGPEDFNRSVMGRFCLRYWKNRIPVVPRGGFNCVDVRDVARAHLLAAERGASGRRYVLGGENRTLVDLTRELGQVRGRPSRWSCRIPPWLHTSLAWCAEFDAARKNRQPHTTVQEARMASLYWFYSSERARAELGYEPRPLRDALQDAHEWFCQVGRLRPGRGQEPERTLPIAA
jgi:dihydroflavonol-4-reductase